MQEYFPEDCELACTAIYSSTAMQRRCHSYLELNFHYHVLVTVIGSPKYIACFLLNEYA